MLSRPALLLKLEEAVLLLAAILLYQHLHFSWILFAVFFLTPDLTIFGFLAGPKIGSAVYNLGHTVAYPILLGLAAYTTSRPALAAAAIIWFSHIAFDRLLGYGLKYPTHFKDTHLQHLD
jgi:hypothetical protein